MGKSFNPVDAIVSPVTSLATSGINAASQAQTNKMNLQMMREQNQFNHAESELQWQREKEMFNMENQYNNPVEVVNRLRSAGINPSVALSGSLGSAMSSAASGGQPVAATAAGYPAAMVSPFSNFATGVLDSSLKASQILKTLADAKKAGADTKRIEALLNFEVNNAQLQNEFQQMQNHLTKTYGEIKASRENDLLYEQIQKVIQDTFTSASQGHLNYEKARESEQNIQNLTAQMDLTKEQKKLLEKENQVFFASWNREMALKSAQINESNASATEHISGAAKNNAETEGIRNENEWIDEKNAQGISEGESRTYKNYIEGKTPNNYIQVGSKAVDHKSASHEAHGRRDKIIRNHRDNKKSRSRRR